MTKVFVAKPALPQLPITPHQGYSLSPDAKALALKGDNIVNPLTYPIRGKGPYLTTAGSEFDFELNILDTASKLPIRAVGIESGLSKGFTDRLGRIVFRLPRGHNKVVINGSGYIERGSFAPEAVKFEPIQLEVDLDSDAIYTVYSTGEVIPGERRVDNPRRSSGELEAFLRDYWWAIGLVGVTGLGMYYLGKSKPKT